MKDIVLKMSPLTLNAVTTALAHHRDHCHQALLDFQAQVAAQLQTPQDIVGAAPPAASPTGEVG